MLPEKPKVELCTLDVPAQEAICGQTQSSEQVEKHGSKLSLSQIMFLMQAPNGPVERKPISYVDRGVAIRPDEWVKVRNYIDGLERYIQMNCK
jgi:hypothetical protein